MSITITIPLAVPRLPQDPARLLLAVGEPCLILLAAALGLGPIGQTLVTYGLKGAKHIAIQEHSLIPSRQGRPPLPRGELPTSTPPIQYRAPRNSHPGYWASDRPPARTALPARGSGADSAVVRSIRALSSIAD